MCMCTAPVPAIYTPPALDLTFRNFPLGSMTVNASTMDIGNVGQGKTEGGATKEDDIKQCVDELLTKVDKLEQRVNEVEQFYVITSKRQPNTSNNGPILKDTSKEKHIRSIKKQQQDASHREAAAAKRMQELMRQFGTILRQIAQHKWAWPFMQPVDVEGLGLHDYYEVIDRPMDFSTIKNQMEAKDGTGYKHVREICADMRLVFENAMQYNDEKSDVYMMAKALLEKFEEKWSQLLPKVTEEERRRKEEEAEAELNMQLAREVAHAKMAKDLSNKLYEVDMHLEELRESVVQKCRKISTEEKRNIGIALARFSPEQLSKALEIVAQTNPSFQATSPKVDLDIDAQSENTLWRLKFFAKEALEVQGKASTMVQGKASTMGGANTTNNPNAAIGPTSKRKGDKCDSVAKKQSKK